MNWYNSASASSRTQTQEEKQTKQRRLGCSTLFLCLYHSAVRNPPSLSDLQQKGRRRCFGPDLGLFCRLQRGVADLWATQEAQAGDFGLLPIFDNRDGDRHRYPKIQLAFVGFGLGTESIDQPSGFAGKDLDL